ncbi:LysR family transcriptional regulator [Acinetobacter pittii]|uniref:LysR family transcriptional regulator n=1 Tax=Acinetobacter pittii TaxID=48296 RepID=UPI001EFDDC11|nr:LysR family transcriptional regulator [Acinetobacter pittii]
MLKWDQLRIILAISREGSFSKAAKTLEIDHTTVSRHLDSLEKELGILFNRRANGVFPTLLGLETIAIAEKIEAEINSLLRHRDSTELQLTGTVRLTTTPFFSANLFAPALNDFFETHPGLKVELIGDNQNLDLSRREADVAVRFSRPTNKRLVIRSLGRIAFAFYALKTDLRSFEAQSFLSYDEASAHYSLQKYIDKVVPEEKIILRSNSTQVLLESTYTGAGCTLLPCFIGDTNSRLRRVPGPNAMEIMTLWLTYHEDLRNSPKLQAVIEFIDQIIAKHRSGFIPHDFPFEIE